MNKLIISMIVLSAVVFTGCSSSSYPTSERYPDRVIIQDGYYPPGYYGPQYYGGGYYPPTGIYRNQYSRRRPAVIYRAAPRPRVIKDNPRVNPSRPQANWNRGNDKNIRSDRDKNNNNRSRPSNNRSRD